MEHSISHYNVDTTGMHIASAWILAYDFLTMATTYCSMEHFLEPKTFSKDYTSTKFAEMLPLVTGQFEGKFSTIPGKPMDPPNSLPPELTPSLNLEFISDTWRSELSKVESAAKSVSCDEAPQKRCIFSWVAGLCQQQDNVIWIEEAFKPYAKESNGWKVVNEGGKFGYMPSRVGDKMVLEFPNLSQPFRSVTFFFLKSYGEKWEGSKLSASVAEKGQGTDWKVLKALEMTGIHAKNTSETYPETMTLPHSIPAGSSAQVSYRLAGGTTFKIQGLAVCS